MDGYRYFVSRYNWSTSTRFDVLSSEYPQFGMTESSDLDRIFSIGYDHAYFINSLIKISSNSRLVYKNLLKKVIYLWELLL